MNKMLALLSLGLLGSVLAQGEDRAGWPKVINFGLIPTEGSADITARFQPLFDHIEKTLGVQVKPFVGADYAAVIVAMGSGKVDVAYFGPASYVQAAERSGAVAFAKENAVKSGLGYHSVIISKANSGIKTLADAKGKDFAFTDPNSTSGYLVPISHFLQDMKVKPEDYFGRVTFSGSHEANILGVANGRIPVAATNDLDLARAVEKGAVKNLNEFNVLWTSDLIPASPLAYRKSLPESFKTALQSAVLNFKDPRGLAQLELKGYAPAKDSDYDGVRKLEEVKKQLNK